MCTSFLFVSLGAKKKFRNKISSLDSHSVYVAKCHTHIVNAPAAICFSLR